jgi:hypothetical protein
MHACAHACTHTRTHTHTHTHARAYNWALQGGLSVLVREVQTLSTIAAKTERLHSLLVSLQGINAAGDPVDGCLGAGESRHHSLVLLSCSLNLE